MRGDAHAIRLVDPLLASGDAAICGPIFAEVISGAATHAQMEKLARQLGGLDWVEPPAGIWPAIGRSRFALARLGVQAHAVDLFIAHAALGAACGLLTRDRDFEDIARLLPIDVEVF